MHVWHWRFQVHHVQSWIPGILTTQVGDPATCKTHLTPKTKLTWADEESWLSLDSVYRVSCKWVVVIEWLLISWLVICGILDFNAMGVIIQTYVPARPSRFPPSPIVIYRIPQGSGFFRYALSWLYYTNVKVLIISVSSVFRYSINQAPGDQRWTQV